MPGLQRSCPCGSGSSLDGCCGPLLRAETLATTAEQLMRSRYSAYALGDLDHLIRSWHPRTRPRDLRLDPDVAWLGLVVHETSAGGPTDASGTVRFTARYRDATGNHSLDENSGFARRAGRWVYEGPVD